MSGLMKKGLFFRNCDYSYSYVIYFINLFFKVIFWKSTVGSLLVWEYKGFHSQKPHNNWDGDNRK